MRNILHIIVLIYSFSLSAQQHSYDYLVNQYCQAIDKIDFSDRSKKEVMQINIALGKKLRQENADTIEYVLQTIQNQNDTLTQMEAMIIYSKHYLHDIIYHCDSYLKINRLSIEDCPPETKSMQYITLRVNNYLQQHPEYSYREVLDSVGFKSLEYSLEIKKQLKEDYNEEFIYPNTLINYLLYQSDAYMRAWLYNQSLKLF